MPLPPQQAAAIESATVTAAPAHIVAGAKKAAKESRCLIAIFFDSAQDFIEDPTSPDKGYGYGPEEAVDLLFHPALGRVVALVRPNGVIDNLG